MIFIFIFLISSCLIILYLKIIVKVCFTDEIFHDFKEIGKLLLVLILFPITWIIIFLGECGFITFLDSKLKIEEYVKNNIFSIYEDKHKHIVNINAMISPNLKPEDLGFIVWTIKVKTPFNLIKVKLPSRFKPNHSIEIL